MKKLLTIIVILCAAGLFGATNSFPLQIAFRQDGTNLLTVASGKNMTTVPYRGVVGTNGTFIIKIPRNVLPPDLTNTTSVTYMGILFVTTNAAIAPQSRKARP